MFLESFRHLIEILALKKQNNLNFAQITSENKRISDLEERRKKTVLENENLKIENSNLKLQETQNLIEDLGLRLNKLSSQLSLATTVTQENAFKNQIQNLESEIEKLEEQYFKNLETSEALLLKIHDNEVFLKGSEATLEEIKNEVLIAVAKENNSIENRNKRIDSLMEQCHPSLKNLYLELDKKFAPKEATSFLIDKKCSACYVTADATLRSSLEEGRSIEMCPHCGRLLIPETAKIY